MKVLLFLVIGLIPCFVLAQKGDRGSIWIMADSIGIDFSQNPPRVFNTVVPDSNKKNFQLGSTSTAASIKINNDMLYIQPYDINIYDPTKPRGNDRVIGCHLRNVTIGNSIIKNGDSLVLSNDGTAAFIPIDDSLIHLFTTGYRRGHQVFYYDDTNYKDIKPFNPRLFRHTIIRDSNSQWIVSEKNQEVVNIDIIEKKLAAVKHHNGKDWWLFAHERNASNGFLRFFISEKGIEQLPTQYIGRIHFPTFPDSLDQQYERLDYTYAPNGFDDLLYQHWGNLTISTDGTKLACYGEFLKPFLIKQSDGSILHAKPQSRRYIILDVFDIDRCTGEFYNWKDMPSIREFDTTSYATIQYCAFSPSAKYIYFTYGSSTLVDRQKAKTLFKLSLNGKEFNFIDIKKYTTNNIPTFFWVLSRYGDKIYLGGLNRENNPLLKNKTIPYIANPDTADINQIDFKVTGLDLSGKYLDQALPDNSNYDLGPVPPLPFQKKPVAYRDTLCPQDTTRLGGYFPSGRFVHQWSPAVGLSFVKGDSGTVLFHPLYIPKQDTLYTYVMTTSGRPNSCHDGEITTDTFRILVHGRNYRPCFVSVPEPEAPPSPKILVYPNPTNGTLYLKSEGTKMLRFMLYNPNGQIAFEQNLSASEATLHIGDLADGTYICKIITTEGIFTQKVMLIH